uniref:Uncharacterized protein n=1 Tax=Panagrolaimus sp. ES5 TaxID=591445 RepID=A0AC34GNK1_9BILA
MARKISEVESSDPKPPPSNALQNFSVPVGHKNRNPYENEKFIGFVQNKPRRLGQNSGMISAGGWKYRIAENNLSSFPGTGVVRSSYDSGHRSRNFEKKRRCGGDPHQDLLYQLPFYFGSNRDPLEDDHDNHPLPIHVTQNFDPFAADGAYFDLDVHCDNPIVPPLFVSEQQQHDDDPHRRCSASPPSLAHFDHEQHNIITAPPTGHVTISSAAVNEYLIDVKKGISRTWQYYQLWDMEHQQQYAQLAAGFIQTPPQSNHMDFEDYPVGHQTEAEALENAAENYILDGQVFRAQREIQGYNGFEVRVVLGEDFCTYDMGYSVYDAYGGCQYSDCGWIIFPGPIYRETFHHWVQDGYLNVEAELV